MTSTAEDDQLIRLVRELCRLPSETPWLDFKRNNTDPAMIGDLISGISNAAALAGREIGYVVWGVADGTHEIVGTSFQPAIEKKGGEELESWLARNLSPRLNIRLRAGSVEGLHVVVLEIPAARDRPTAFGGKESVRIGSTTRTLRDHPESERSLWRCFDRTPFERQVARPDVPDEEVRGLLDCGAYFELLKLPEPTDQSAILEAMATEALVRRNDAGRWDITNLGAVLFARDLGKFPTLSRKAVRVIVYKGSGRLLTEREHVVSKGYAVGFEGIIEFLKAVLPTNEVIGEAFRRDVPMYPDPALRELIANALIHQDFTVTGAGPMVEVFERRVEISNPGEPLGEVGRLLDQAPRSRNEALAALMRRIGLCEERGSGIDKVVFETEFFQLPAPVWEAAGGTARATLFAHKTFREMDRGERVHACYLHACLRHVMHEPMTNTSLRERFGIDERNAATASRIIRDALEAGVIKPYDPDQGKRHARYLPAWA